MKRTFLDRATVLSTAVLALAVTLWVVGNFRGFAIDWNSTSAMLTARMGGGFLMAGVYTPIDGRFDPPEHRWEFGSERIHPSRDPHESWLELNFPLPAFAWAAVGFGTNAKMHLFLLPWWLVCLVALPLPAWRVFRRLRDRRASRQSRPGSHPPGLRPAPPPPGHPA